MPRIRIKHNIDDVQRALKKNSKKVAFHISIAIRKSAFIVEGLAKRDAPVDTGRLRSSISSSIFPLIATVQPTVNYAVFVHEGTAFISANPFMTRASRAAQIPIASVFSKEIGKALK